MMSMSLVICAEKNVLPQARVVLLAPLETRVAGKQVVARLTIGMLQSMGKAANGTNRGHIKTSIVHMKTASKDTVKRNPGNSGPH